MKPFSDLTGIHVRKALEKPLKQFIFGGEL